MSPTSGLGSLYSGTPVPPPLVSTNNKPATNCASGNCGNSGCPGISMTQVIVGVVTIYAINMLINKIPKN